MERRGREGGKKDVLKEEKKQRKSFAIEAGVGTAG